MRPLNVLYLFALILAVPCCRSEEMSCEADGSCTEEHEGFSQDELSTCEDKYDKCEGWSSSGECLNNPNFMLNHCMKSCDMCSDFENQPENCRDRYVPCKLWAVKGECQTNAKFMGENCPFSCNACPEEEAQCKDSDERCEFWASEGECLVNAWMESNCPMSCYLCVNEDHSKARGESDELIQRKKVFASMNLGDKQSMQMEGEDLQGVQDVLRRMDRYAKEIVTEPEMDGARDQCKNEHFLCAFWSSVGKCEDNASYMQRMCPLACLSCEYIEKFNRCTRESDSKAAFERGSIDKLFNDIKNGQRDELQPSFVTMPNGDGSPDDPWIVRFENFLTEEECDRLINLGNTVVWKPEEGKKEAHSAVCNKSTNCESDLTHMLVVDKLEKITGAPRANFEYMELTKYGVSGSDKIHHDYKGQDSWLPAGPRILTLLIFLSDVEGGAVGFPDLDWLLIKPKKGHALLWPNVLDDNLEMADDKMIYEELPVVKGEKFVAKVWLHLYDWKNNVDDDCV